MDSGTNDSKTILSIGSIFKITEGTLNFGVPPLEKGGETFYVF